MNNLDQITKNLILIKKERTVKEIELYKICDIEKNVLNIMELYDMFSPIIKEKYVIEKIINMKYNMETCKLKQQIEELKIEELKIKNQLIELL